MKNMKTTSRKKSYIKIKTEGTEKYRECLGLECGKYFLSSGPGNRFCKICSLKNEKEYNPKEYKSSGEEYETDDNVKDEPSKEYRDFR